MRISFIPVFFSLLFYLPVLLSLLRRPALIDDSERLVPADLVAVARLDCTLDQTRCFKSTPLNVWSRLKQRFRVDPFVRSVWHRYEALALLRKKSGRNLKVDLHQLIREPQNGVYIVTSRSVNVEPAGRFLSTQRISSLASNERKLHDGSITSKGHFQSIEFGNRRKASF